MKPKRYLDTSIPSAYYDTSKPIRQLMTQNWFLNEAQNYDLYMSVIAVEEIDAMLNLEKKENIKNLMVENDIKILDLNEKAEKLSKEYMSQGAIPESEPEDAMHVAIATVNEIELLASWNFKHIVSINPIKKIHEINREHD